MNFVEKHSKLLAVALCVCAAGPVISTVHAYEVQPGWHTNGEVSYYVLDNHKRATGLTEIENEKYYFNQNGELQYGWQNVDNETYYFDNNGQAVTGKSEIQGTTYNFQQTGSLDSGWNDDGTYHDEKGFKVANTWVNDEGYKYYFDENGQSVKNSWKEIEGNRYYFDEEGRTAIGNVDVDGTTYYTDDQGIVKQGWQNENGATTYYNEDGSQYTDKVLKLDDASYAFDDNGALLTDTTIDGYTINEAGQITDYTAPAEDVVNLETPAPEAPAAEDAVVEDAPVAEEAPVVEDVAAPDYTEEPVVDEAVVEDAPVAEEPVYEEEIYDEPVYEEVAPEPIPEVVAPEVVAPEEDVIVEDYEEPAEDIYIPEEEPVYVEDPVVVEPAPEPAPAPAPEVSYDKASTIYNAAMSQIGVNQDCTMLVTNSLAAAGISFHGWPEEYSALGDWTSNPVPGDIIIYSGHVAVYAGNGMAVHGGWNGYTTALFSVNCSAALIGYIHVR